jgi:hypothetical protein
MESLAVINTILASIEAFGYIKFATFVVVDIVLWRIHPILGLLGVLFTFALLLHLI